MRKNALSDEILMAVEKPARYLGNEYNAYHKDFDAYPVKAVFCFPDVYEIGTANLGMQIIYEQFNENPEAMCDRVYSPWFDLDKVLREKKIPLFAVETQRPVRDFDLLLITLSYEMCYTNVLQILDLSQIPLLSKDRTEKDPIVFGGGACAYNPEPIADFFDVFYIGESETQYGQVIKVIKEAKEAGLTRLETLEALADIEGLYIPAFYEASYKEDGTIRSFLPVNPHAKEKVKKQAADMRKALPYPHRPLVPYERGMMDRASLEVMRGCIRGCRFCQAGMIYRPQRNRDLDFLKQAAKDMLETTGYEEINLGSLSSSDYSELKDLLDFLVPYCEERKINIGIPSLRIDAFSLDVMSRIQDIKKTSLTFAPEAGSQRLRDIINKGLTEEEILEGARQAFSGGWNKVKLYFMLGQPMETDDDVSAIPVLADKIARVYYETVPKEMRQGKCQIQASTSFFVPKPMTPFQWAAMQSSDEFIRKAKLVKEGILSQLNRKSLVYHYHDDHQTELEGLLARGDRRVGKTILKAYEKGCIYDAWNEHLKYELWLEAMEETGVTFDFYNYREREEDEIFPWDFIDIGVTKGFMLKEWRKAKQGLTTPNCREQCSGCGAACYPGGVCYENKD